MTRTPAAEGAAGVVVVVVTEAFGGGFTAWHVVSDRAAPMRAACSAIGAFRVRVATKREATPATPPAAEAQRLRH